MCSVFCDRVSLKSREGGESLRVSRVILLLYISLKRVTENNYIKHEELIRSQCLSSTCGLDQREGIFRSGLGPRNAP